MPTRPLSGVIQYLRGTLLPEGTDLTDGQLLERFVSRHETAALEALVRRNGPMVWGVCRRILHNHHDAEDAFQATFLVLVRKAGSIRCPAKICNWLYGVAHQTALKARATRAKRKLRETQVNDMPDPAVVDQGAWKDLLPVLDQELSRLPERYRAIIVLCDLQGKSRQEAARSLDCPVGTVGSRLARARTMLAKRIGRHGSAISGATLAATLSQQTASACVPASVMTAAIKIVTLVAAGQAAGGAISATATALAEGVIKVMLLNKLKMAAVVLLVLGSLGVGGVYTHQMVGAQPGPSSQPAGEPQITRTATSNKDRAKTDTDRIQGTWDLVKCEMNGVETPFAFMRAKGEESSRAKVAGNKLTTNFMELREFTFRLDPASKPKAIDLHPLEEPRKTLFGIYRMAGYDLTLCFCLTGKQQRPAAFEDYWQPGSHTVLLRFKRHVIRAGEVLGIEVDGTLPNAPIRGFYTVSPSGNVSLGFFYGRVHVEGATLEEAEKAVSGHLANKLIGAKVHIGPTSAGTAPGRTEDVQQLIRRIDELEEEVRELRRAVNGLRKQEP
jgi:RNA polymerase sigma factor (sigma-70 family)